MRSLPVLLLFSALAHSQDHPQFIWQGEVDDVAILYLRANHLDTQAKEGAPPANPQFHFYDRLPDTRQDARVEVRKGRGFVHIIDQPRLENRYTLAVSIEDRQPGASFYSIALYWDTSTRSFEQGAGRSDHLTWTGRVDEEALITCQDKGCTSSVTRGAPVAAEHVKFSRPLPHRDAELSLESQEGRGEIHLVEQPREKNNYTARVSIRDPQAGSGEYSFTLVWRRPSNKEAALPAPEARRGMTWSGMVSGRARITIHGSSSISEGGSISGERVDFLIPLPARSDLHPAVKKISGPGKVEILESPSEQNNYRLVFEISDSEPGPSHYEIEVDW